MQIHLRKSGMRTVGIVLFILIFATGCTTGAKVQEDFEKQTTAGKIVSVSDGEPSSTDDPNNQNEQTNQNEPNGSEQANNENGTDSIGKGTDENHQAPVPPKENAFKPPFTFTYPDAVRGIYVTAHSAGGSRFNQLLKLVQDTELNAMVIDIKDDYGNITLNLEGTPLEEFSKPIIRDPKALLETLHKNNIYPIARIVVFKDSTLAVKHPEYSFVENGSIWKNGRGESFVNPFLPEVWKHNVEIAKKAAELGFAEIQFDYVRFPEGFEKMDQTLVYSMGEYKDKIPVKFQELENKYQTSLQEYEKKRRELQNAVDQSLARYNELKTKLDQEKANPQTEAQSQTIQTGGQSADSQANNLAELEKQVAEAKQALDKANAMLTAHEQKKPVQPNFSDKERLVQLRVDAVTDFVAFAKMELEPYGVDVSVDIFGYSATLPEAPGIGQNFSRISQQVDVISSMIYPSHWGPGYFNIPKPDKEPYRLVKEYVKAEKEKLSQLEKPPVSRPWIQDFSAPWLGKGNYLPYGKAEVEAQIRALNEGGISEYLIWNPSNRYTQGVDYTPLQK
jgi:hypothetical protein